MGIPTFGTHFGHISRLSAQYREKIKSHDVLVDPVFKACKFDYTKKELRLLDAMSGPGGLGLELLAKFDLGRPKGNTTILDAVFSDARREPLKQIDDAFPSMPPAIHCDVHGLRSDQKFDVAVVRYGLTELTNAGIQIALSHIRGCLAPGSRVVVADFAPAGEEARDGLSLMTNAVRYWFGRTKRMADCPSTIPTAAEWPGRLVAAGYTDVRVEFNGVLKNLDASQWAGKLDLVVDAKGIKAVNGLLLNTCLASQAFAREFNFRAGDEKVTFDLPVIVVAGDMAGGKPAT